MKVPFGIYDDTYSLFEKIDAYYNNSEKSSTTKVTKHTACSYSLFTHCCFDNNKNKHDYYRGEYCMKNFCKRLKE